MKHKLKKTAFVLLIIALIFSAYYVYRVHFEYRFTEISESKVYSSAVIPPEKIDNFIEDHNIKTVIDLRIGSLVDELNPGVSSEIESEKKAVESISGVDYINIPSKQIPSDENLEDFFKVLDNEDAYPVLIHCYHGTGRAPLYSALYRIEYENFSNEEARRKVRLLLKYSSFDDGEAKGEWLKNYQRRKTNN